MQLREIPHSDIPKALKNHEVVSLHGNHFFMGNSGFENAKTWDDSLRYTESLAKFLWDQGTLHDGKKEKLSEIISDVITKGNYEFFARNKELRDEVRRFERVFRPQYHKPNALHGGGTLYEYFQQETGVFSVTMHGVRGIKRPLISYEGEPIDSTPRGKFAVEHTHMIHRYLKEETKERGKIAILAIEKENLGQSPEAKAVYDHYAPSENSTTGAYGVNGADIAIFSTHAIDMNGDPESKNIKNLRFIDGSNEHFANILTGHERKDFADAALASIVTYIRSQTVHINTLAPRTTQEIKVLGHCDLIKLAIHKAITKTNLPPEETQRFIETLFKNPIVIKSYQELFRTCVTHNVCIELNISGEAKGVGVYPSKPIAQLAVEKGAKLVYATDAHSLEQMHASKSEKLRNAFLSAIPDGASIWTV